MFILIENVYNSEGDFVNVDDRDDHYYDNDENDCSNDVIKIILTHGELGFLWIVSELFAFMLTWLVPDLIWLVPDLTWLVPGLNWLVPDLTWLDPGLT